MSDYRNSLIDSIKSEHKFLSKHILLLQDQIRQWKQEENTDYKLVELLMYFIETFPDQLHHKKEEFIYDALIRNGLPESEYLARLKLEHDGMELVKEKFLFDMSHFLDQRAKASHNSVESIIKYINLQKDHMYEEESQFLPVAQDWLPEARFVEINVEIQRTLINKETQDSFRKLAKIQQDISAYLS